MSNTVTAALLSVFGSQKVTESIIYWTSWSSWGKKTNKQLFMLIQHFLIYLHPISTYSQPQAIIHVKATWKADVLLQTPSLFNYSSEDMEVLLFKGRSKASTIQVYNTFAWQNITITRRVIFFLIRSAIGRMKEGVISRWCPVLLLYFITASAALGKACWLDPEVIPVLRPFCPNPK